MLVFFFQHPRKTAAAAAAGALFLVAALCGGCGGSESGTVAGTVKSAGKPVVFGTVTVIGSDNKPYTAPIQPDGSYVVNGVPPGPVRVSVVSTNPRPRWGKAAAPAANAPTAGGGAAGPVAGGGPNAAGGTTVAKGGGKAGGVGKSNSRDTLSASIDIEPPPVAGPEAHPLQDKWFPIPGKYASPQTSGLGASAGRGRTKFDINVD